MPSFRSIGLVALFDLYESLRARRAIALLALYLIAALGATAVFVKMVRAAYDSLGGYAGLAQSYFESKEFTHRVGEMLGSVELAKTLVGTPPIALFYGWLALLFVPLLVVLTSSDAVAADRESGAARFMLFRVDRLSWVLGKFLGQLFLMTVGLALGALGSYILGALFLPGFEPAATAGWLLRLSGRACCYGFAFMGVAFCASQWARSAAKARSLGLVMLVGLWLLGGLSRWTYPSEWLNRCAALLHKLLPGSYQLSLWDPEVTTRLGAIGILLLIGVVFFSLGYSHFTRQDA